MFPVLALLFGQAVLLAGLFLVWPPLPLIVAGVELTAWALVYNPQPKREAKR